MVSYSRFRYRPQSGEPVAVVIKEGGLRYPPPYPGERGVGFNETDTPAAQLNVGKSMWYGGFRV